MPASLHLARFTPRHAARTTGRLWRSWETLLATPGLGHARLFMLAVLDPVAGGTLLPTRWGVLCGWTDAERRDAACATGLRRLTRDASEAWEVALDPVRIRSGSDLRGWRPSTEGAERLARDEPVMVLTHGRVRPRHLWNFTTANQRIVKAMTGDPGLELMLGLVDHPTTRATFSLWHSKGDVVRFAYGHDTVHSPVQRTAQDVPWAEDWFFARFRPVASSGTWGGCDPLQAMRTARTVD